MLIRPPKVGQFIKVLETGEYPDTKERYQTKGDIHEIVGVSPTNDNVYFIGDLNRKIYIDEYSCHMYVLCSDSENEDITADKVLMNKIREIDEKIKTVTQERSALVYGTRPYREKLTYEIDLLYRKISYLEKVQFILDDLV